MIDGAHDRPWLTVLLGTLPEFSPQGCCAALESAGAAGQVLMVACEEAVRTHIMPLGQDMVRRGAMHAFRCYSPSAGQSCLEALNQAAGQVRTPYLLLLSSAVRLLPGSLPAMRRRLESSDQLAGVNPLFLYRQQAFVSPVSLADTVAPSQPRIAHMGSAGDCLGQLRYLYEGLPLAHELARKRRFFQLAHVGALLLRREDFLSTGGFATALDELAPQDFCLRLAAPQPGAPGREQQRFFSSEPDALAVLADDMDSWKTCGLWNSLLLRGRLHPGLLHPDQPEHARQDGLDYACTDWLHPEPSLTPGREQDMPAMYGMSGRAETSGAPGRPDISSILDSSDTPAMSAWLRWRHDPRPQHLLDMMGLLPHAQQRAALALCRDLPDSLPRALSWYVEAARSLRSYGHVEGYSVLATRAGEWLQRAEAFRHESLRPGMRALQEEGLYACGLDNCPAIYDAWLELVAQENSNAKTVSQDVAGQKNQCSTLTVGRQWPIMAVVMPVYSPQPDHLRAALDSVLAQTYPYWQLCIADDASPDPHTPEILRAYAAQDARLRYVRREGNGHISLASNSALELVDAPWTGFFDHDDLLAPAALALMAEVAVSVPRLGLAFSDEDKVDSRGVRRTPIFKGDFDPWTQYVWHFSVYSTELLRRLGGLRAGLEGSQDYDLSLRATECLGPEQIVHVPEVLYHWRIHEGSSSGALGAKPYVLEATRRALNESAVRQGLSAVAAPAGRNNFYALRFAVPTCKCSVVLLARHGRPVQAGLWQALTRLAAILPLEVLCQPVATDGGAAFAAAPASLGARLLPPPQGREEGDWNAACNLAARAACGDALLFLDASLLPHGDCRPEQLLALALQPGVGTVGGMLRHGDILWHAGLMPDVDGQTFALQRGADCLLLPSLCWGQLLLTRRVLAAPQQALAVARQVFLGHDGLNPGLGAWAGADLALRMAAAGRHSLVCPWAWWQVAADGLDVADSRAGLVNFRGRGVGHCPESKTETPQALEKFLALWGVSVQKSGLRNRNLCAGSDQGWTLMLEKKLWFAGSEHAGFANACAQSLHDLHMDIHPRG